MLQPQIVVIAHNIRSTHNIGAIFRTCEGFGVEHLYLTGYSPYPLLAEDSRLPHISRKLSQQISKSALGAEKSCPFSHKASVEEALAALSRRGFTIAGLEQDDRSIPLPDYLPPKKIALLLGEEVEGIDQSLRAHCEDLLEIPMFGQKESFNVSVACGIALYGLRFGNEHTTK